MTDSSAGPVGFPALPQDEAGSPLDALPRATISEARASWIATAAQHAASAVAEELGRPPTLAEMKLIANALVRHALAPDAPTRRTQ